MPSLTGASFSISQPTGPSAIATITQSSECESENGRLPSFVRICSSRIHTATDRRRSASNISPSHFFRLHAGSVAITASSAAPVWTRLSTRSTRATNRSSGNGSVLVQIIRSRGNQCSFLIQQELLRQRKTFNSIKTADSVISHTGYIIIVYKSKSVTKLMNHGICVHTGIFITYLIKQEINTDIHKTVDCGLAVSVVAMTVSSVSSESTAKGYYIVLITGRKEEAFANITASKRPSESLSRISFQSE